MDEPAIQYARTKDGVNIAYSMVGKGPLLVDVPQSGFAGLYALEIPAFSNYYEELSKRFTILGFDQRGFGHSQRGDFQFSLESHLADLEAVIEAAGVGGFTLFAGFWSTATGVAYADAHTGRVRSLILWQGFLDGGRRAKEASGAALIPLISRDFELFMLTATATTYPPTALDSERMVEHCLRVMNPDATIAFFAASSSVDATAIAETVDVPTLVLQGRESPPSVASASQDIAARIPGARLQQLSGRSSYPAFGDINETVEAIADFVDALETPGAGGPAPPTAFQTIMFTDLESSTALTQKVGDEAAQDVLHGHNDAVRKALEDNGGREVKHTGDGIMAAFPSAVRAVEAALQIQRDLAGGEVRVRIGLNAGEPIAEDDDFFGTVVQLAARICDRAEPGQVLVSNVVRELCAGKKLTFQHRSDATLKGFDEPVALFEVRD